jgi:hypothetical protein
VAFVSAKALGSEEAHQAHELVRTRGVYSHSLGPGESQEGSKVRIRPTQSSTPGPAREPDSDGREKQIRENLIARS